MTSVNVNTAMYYTRVETFKFGTNGIGMPFFNKFKRTCS
ncbi:MULTISPECIES: RAxF-45 family protein [unclassified Lysinibacillus]|nr:MULTISPECIES: RAxF-45 family protein [unclassified Lysinibacillus]